MEEVPIFKGKGWAAEDLRPGYQTEECGNNVAIVKCYTMVGVK